MRILHINVLLLILLSVEARKKTVNCNKLQRKCDRGRENACRKIRKHCSSTVAIDSDVEENLPTGTFVTPGKPGGIAVSAYTTRIEVQWLPSTSEAPVEGYALGYGKNIPDIYSATLGPDTFTYVINDVEPNSLYVISLRAFNQIGYGPSIYEIVETIEDAAQEPRDHDETTTIAEALSGQTPLGGRQDPPHEGVHSIETGEDQLLLDAEEYHRPETTDHPV